MVNCEICHQPTQFDATKRCNRCWELETRIEADPLIALKIIHKIEAITQISMFSKVDLKFSGPSILALTNFGRLFCKQDGFDDGWILVDSPNFEVK